MENFIFLYSEKSSTEWGKYLQERIGTNVYW